MRKTLSALTLTAAGAATATAGENDIFAPVPSQPFTFSAPLHPGPGTVPLPMNRPSGLAAPILLPMTGMTAAPMALFGYPAPPKTVDVFGASHSEPIVETPSATTALAEPAKPCGSRFYGSADFFYGATQGTYLPPLVTVSPAGSPATAGGLFNPTTVVALGGGRTGDSTRPGANFRFGYWCDDAHRTGVDFGFFFLGDQSQSFNGYTSPGNLALAQPLVNGTTATNFGLQPGALLAGGLAATVGTDVIGADVNLRKGLKSTACSHCDVVMGFRYLHLGDSVEVASTTGAFVAAGPGPAVAGSVLTVDSFRTRNNFYGPQVGVIAGRTAGRFSVDATMKLALGANVASTDISGGTATNANGFPIAGTATGLLASGSNSGSYNRSDFAVVPEAGVKLGYGLTEHVRATAGYTFVYWSSVQRAPEQIDLTVLSPGRPAFPDRTTDFWIQGFTLGLDWKW